MLKFIGFYKLAAILTATLVAVSPLVLPSHVHFTGTGDGNHALIPHTCGKDEIHLQLHAGDSCATCLRTGLYVASFGAEGRTSNVSAVGLVMQTVNLRLSESGDPTSPRRGPPIPLA